MTDPEVGFVTPTQAGDLTTPPQGAAPSTLHQWGAHQVPFNLGEVPQGIGPVHVHYNDLGEPHDPTAPEGQAQPPASLISAALHDCFGNSASDDDDEPMDDDLSFVKGDVHDFSYRMLKLIRGGRKAAYRLPDQLQAWAARCDKTTDAISCGFRTTPIGGVVRLYFADIAAAAAHDVENATAISAGHEATLLPFAQWFKATFPKVEVVREAKRQIEYDFGQTQALEHHNAEFNELLEKLPGNDLLAQATHIDHYLS